jgi:tRNA threonylcarbamoyladenosine modification (KEOPS) complex Cgi121 subunit
MAGKITIRSVQAFLRELDAIAQSSNTTIQAADATKVAGRRHVDCAVRNAMRSFRDHRNIATDLGVELLLHLSACRQIRKALEIGVHEGEMDVLLIVVGATKSIERTATQLTSLIQSDPRVIEYDETKKKPLMHAFNITKQEIAAAGGDSRIPDLVQERLVLFDAFR